MAGLRNEDVQTMQVAEELGVSPRRVQQLYSSYLEACAKQRENEWAPGRSGGGHSLGIPKEVTALWRKMLTAKPAASYSFVASESDRRLQFAVDRATVRRWALREAVGHSPTPKPERVSVRRWQCESVGALWQLDVTTHRWFGEGRESFPLFDMVDDCSRVITGARLYPRECLLAYLDFLSRAFDEYGIPLALYVDYHSFFFTQLPDLLTYLGEALHYLDISFKYAPTPEAKGKIERLHQFWQNRLPSFFSAEKIDQIVTANPPLHDLRLHHNENEIHREIGLAPAQAWRQAKKEKRFVLRPRPATPWWPYLWSIRNPIKIPIDGTVLVGDRRVNARLPFGTRLIRCEHPDGSFTFLANDLGSGGKPIVVRHYQASVPTWRI
jgi:transposase InsO family protein